MLAGCHLGKGLCCPAGASSGLPQCHVSTFSHLSCRPLLKAVLGHGSGEESTAAVAHLLPPARFALPHGLVREEEAAWRLSSDKPHRWPPGGQVGLPPSLHAGRGPAAYSAQRRAWQSYPPGMSKALEMHRPKAVRGTAALCRTYSSNPYGQERTQWLQKKLRYLRKSLGMGVRGRSAASTAVSARSENSGVYLQAENDEKPRKKVSVTHQPLKYIRPRVVLWFTNYSGLFSQERKVFTSITHVPFHFPGCSCGA